MPPQASELRGWLRQFLKCYGRAPLQQPLCSFAGHCLKKTSIMAESGSYPLCAGALVLSATLGQEEISLKSSDTVSDRDR